MPTAQEEREYQQYGFDVDLRQATLRAADDSLQAARATLLRELSGKLLAHVAWSVLKDGDVAEALIQAAEVGKGSGIQQTSDLLVLTTHGRSGIQRWVLGSVTERVLLGSTLPLFIVRTPEHA
jgi:nucleotide-binding universal stress UspA family protein